ncbi:MAG: hydrolase [Synergistales bacterium]|nr:hydrolase [Synergistales bacterium]
MAVDERLKASFAATLLGTGRKGMQQMLDFLEGTDFYSAPASANHHGNVEGGLLLHSVLTFNSAMSIKRTLEGMRPDISSIPDESLAIVSLLHDVCKAGFYMRSTKNVQDPETGLWSKVACWRVHDAFPLGHGEKSLAMILRQGVELTPDEMLAIRWHMGMAEVNGMSIGEQFAYDDAMARCPLISLLQLGDGASTFLLERKGGAE